MTKTYTDADYLAACKQRNKLLWWFIGITVFYVLFCVGWLIYYISLPYKDPMQALPQACVYVISVLYVVFAFVYMGIPFERANRYYNMLTSVSMGLKDVEKNYFYVFEEGYMQKDNVDMVGCVFETWNKKKCEWRDRVVYWDKEMQLPDFEMGDYIRYIIHSNIVVEYEILQRHALEFVEVDENEPTPTPIMEEESVTTETPTEQSAETSMEQSAETPTEQSADEKETQENKE